MLDATCHCGAVRIEIPRRPRTVTNCDCSVCRRYGALWAYYDPREVRVIARAGAICDYRRGPETLRFVRCASCGCVTHWEPLAPRRADRMGVNLRNFDPVAIGPVRIRLLAGGSTERYVT